MKRDIVKPLDDGTLYITNKPVMFDGHGANKTIKLSNLIRFEPYSDGISLEKATGLNPVIVMGPQAELASVALSEVLARVCPMYVAEHVMPFEPKFCQARGVDVRGVAKGEAPSISLENFDQAEFKAATISF